MIDWPRYSLTQARYYEGLAAKLADPDARARARVLGEGYRRFHEFVSAEFEQLDSRKSRPDVKIVS